MKSKKKHTNQDFEVVDGIGKYMDDDIQRMKGPNAMRTNS